MPELKARVIVCCILLALIGCSGGETVETGSLTGEVKRMNGEPVGEATVVFYPESGPSAIARTDAGGVFKATVPLGKARVAVVANASAISEDTSPEALEKQAEENKSPINPRFSSPDSSGLSVEVKTSQTDKVVLVVE